MKLFKQKHYTVAGMMADLAKEKRLAAVDGIDLQPLIDQIEVVAKRGEYCCGLNVPCPNNSRDLVMPKVKASLERLGFTVSWEHWSHTSLKVWW